MNIHVTSRKPKKCAKALDDKRLNKMITETGQLLSTALHELDLYDPNLFKPFCPNHTVAKWVRKNPTRYWWTVRYFKRLCDEYEYRKDKKQASQRLVGILERALDGVEDKFGQIATSNIDLSFCNYAKNESLDLDYTDMSDTVLAYRKYMIERWNRDDDPTWTDREKPEWTKN